MKAVSFKNKAEWLLWSVARETQVPTIDQSVKYGQNFANAKKIDRLKVFREMGDGVFVGDRNAVLSFGVGAISGHPGTDIFDLGF